MAKADKKITVPATEKMVAVKVIRPWMYGHHIIPAKQGDTGEVVVVELPENLARQLITDQKAVLTTESKNFVLPEKASKKPE